MNRNFYLFAAGVITTLTILYIPNLLTINELTSTMTKRKKVLCFGDSITQHGFNTVIDGWVAKLADWWTRRVDILNRGFSGYTTRWAVLMIQSVVIHESPDFILIFFGANDAVVPENIIHHVPLEEYKSNLLMMISTIKKHLKSVPMVLIGPPPVWEETLKKENIQKGKSIQLDRFNQRTLKYVEVCQEIAKKHSIPFVNAWEGMEGPNENRQEYLSDGLHLNAKGNLKLFELVKNTITKEYPQWTPEAMPMQMPNWNEINYANPKQSLK